MNEEHFTFHLQYQHSGTFANRDNRKWEEFFLLPKSENVRPHPSNAIENATPLRSVKSKLGRTGESELAENSPRLSLASHDFLPPSRFPRSRDHPKGLLAV